MEKFLCILVPAPSKLSATQYCLNRWLVQSPKLTFIEVGILKVPSQHTHVLVRQNILYICSQI